ncbi:mediator of RNA polymerase II transcription subunit 27 [Macrobrachium rosenbergii]|uniref:mediator of RNA polymerase II transcription subunit 27 n=1 Tax=Macrobrachium rosenbergii TaxID=79674 RepID=UPI0034D5A0A9
MAAQETTGSNVETLMATLNNVRSLRSQVTHYFRTVAEGPKESEEDQQPNQDSNSVCEKYALVLENIKNQLRDLETQVGGLTPPTTTTNLGNTGVISLDPSPDKLRLYHQLLDCYTWTEKVHCYSTTMNQLLHGNSLKRSSVPISKRRRPTQYSHNVSQQQVDMTFQSIKQMLQVMTLNVSRPFGNNAVVQVTLGRVLRAVVTLKGLLIEWVVVRAYNEPLLDEEGKVDLYTPSQYKVFQKVTDNANAAMLNFCSPGFTDLSVRSFFTWLHSYQSLFTDVCKRCDVHLRNHMPPTWREFRTLTPFHEECKP